MTDPEPILLLVEDNDEDAFLLRRALQRANVECAVHVAEDGQEAIDYLEGNGPYADRAAYPFPFLAVVDLKLPFVHGFEVIAWISAQSACRDLRVIILTSSGEDPDRSKATQFGISSYFLKPPTGDLAGAVARALQEISAGAQ